MAAKAGIGADDDPHLRPDLAQPLDQKRQDRPGVLGGIDLLY
jgi:hypothetical protein